jgi:Tfp pilus assembly protein PilF
MTAKIKSSAVCIMVTMSSLLVLLLQFHYVEAQEGGKGSPIDYYASHDPGTKEYVHLVTMAHTDKIAGWIRGGRISNALADCKYTLDRVPNHPKGLVLTGMVARLMKNPTLAISYYQKALKLYPQYAVTRAQYGGFLVDIGNAKAGITEIQKAIKMDPNLALGHNLLAKAYLKIGNIDLARQASERARETGQRRTEHKQEQADQEESQ